MSEHEPDRDLVLRARSGDAGAFTELVSRYQGLISAVALHVLGPAADIEDVVQEALIDAFRGLTTYDVARPFGNWLRAIARNRCLRELRSRARRPQQFRSGDDADKLPARAPDIAQEVMERVATLSPPHREVLLLYYVDGYSQKEVAAFTGRAVGTVKRLIHEARAALRKECDSMIREYVRRRSSRTKLSKRALQGIVRRARRLRDAGQTEQAAAAYSEAFERGPALATARVERAWMLWDSGPHQRKARRGAIGELRQAANRHPDDISATLSLAQALALDGRMDRAEKLFKRALEKWPDKEGYILAEKLYAIHCSRPFKEVKAFYGRVTRKFPDHPLVTYNMGWATYCAGKPEQAIRLLERAARLDPTTPAFNNLATIYWDEYGEAGKAVHYMREAARTGSHWLDIMNRMWMCRVGWEHHPRRHGWARESLQVAADFLSRGLLTEDGRPLRTLKNVLAPTRNDRLDSAAKKRWVSLARQIFAEALTKHPRSPWLKLALAETELRCGNLRAVRVLVSKLLRSKSGRQALRFYDAQTDFSSGLPKPLQDRAKAPCFVHE